MLHLGGFTQMTKITAAVQFLEKDLFDDVLVGINSRPCGPGRRSETVRSGAPPENSSYVTVVVLRRPGETS